VNINLTAWLQQIEASSPAAAIRQSLWLYPAIEIVHIIGIVLVAGAAILFDLRLLGVSTKIPVTDIAGHLLTWSKRGLLLVIPSGLLLFITNAEALGYDPTFHLKLILLACAGLNAWTFHRFVYKYFTSQNTTVPKSAKLNAVFSILLWVSIIACGRLLAY
jgi:hypothetical protein